MKDLKIGDIITMDNGETAKITEVGNFGTVWGTRTKSNGNTFTESWSTRTGWDSLGRKTNDIVKINDKKL